MRYPENARNLPAQLPVKLHTKRCSDELCLYLQRDKNGVANTARLTVTFACREIACWEAKEISFPCIFWLTWANHR